MSFIKFILSKKSNILHISICLLFSLILSCNKGIEQTFISEKERVGVNASRDLYERLKVGDILRDTIRSGMIVDYIPQWDSAREYQKNDSSHHTIVPLVPMVNVKGIMVPAISLTDFPFLFILNGKKFYSGRFYTRASENTFRIDEDNIFYNGEMEITDVFTNQIIKYHYENGVGIHFKPLTKKQLSSGRSPKSAFELRCYTKITCTWSADCQGGIYLATSPSGTCQQPPSITPCDYSARWERSVDIKRQECENVWVPDPIDPPPGGGGGGGGSTGATKQDILATTSLTDCHGVKRANEIQKDLNIRNAIKAVQGKPKEWGVEIKLIDPNDPSRFTVGTPFSQGNSNLIKFNPTWNNNSGYTIGFIHNHPSGSAPSPSDIFNASVDLLSMVEDANIPPSQLSLYLNNFVSIIVSDKYVYTITIRQAQSFGYMTREFTGQRQTLENNRYVKSVTDVLQNNGTQISSQQIRTLQESALLKLFDKMFNLNKQMIGDTENNKAVKRDSKGNITTANPCKP